MSDAQCRNRRQRMKNIAHCAQADNEKAEVGLRVQSLIFAQRSAGRGAIPGMTARIRPRRLHLAPSFRLRSEAGLGFHVRVCATPLTSLVQL